MKKAPVLLAVIASLLLGGCANKNEARFRAFSDELRARSDLQVTAAVRAEYDDRSCSFTLRCTEDAEGCSVEVLEPELTELLDNLNVTLYRTCEGPVSIVWEGESFSVRQDPA